VPIFLKQVLKTWKYKGFYLFGKDMILIQYPFNWMYEQFYSKLWCYFKKI
jgi:hypothetical protein